MLQQRGGHSTSRLMCRKRRKNYHGQKNIPANLLYNSSITLNYKYSQTTCADAMRSQNDRKIFRITMASKMSDFTAHARSALWLTRVLWGLQHLLSQEHEKFCHRRHFFLIIWSPLWVLFQFSASLHLLLRYLIFLLHLSTVFFVPKLILISWHISCQAILASLLSKCYLFCLFVFLFVCLLVFFK